MRTFRVHIILIIFICLNSQIYADQGEKLINSTQKNGEKLLLLRYEFSQFEKLNSLKGMNQSEANSKSAWLAFFLSLFLPPSGQLYNGDYTKAAIQAGLVYGGAGLAGSMGCTECGEYGSVQTGLFIAGVVMVFSGYIWSIFDAPISANQINNNYMNYEQSIQNKGNKTFNKIWQNNIVYSVRLKF